MAPDLYLGSKRLIPVCNMRARAGIPSLTWRMKMKMGALLSKIGVFFDSSLIITIGPSSILT
jgi:hypothetical protein